MTSKKREQYLNVEWLCANYPIANRVREAIRKLDEMPVPEIDILLMDYGRFIRSIDTRRNVMSDKLTESFEHHFQDALSVLRLVRIQKASMLHMEKPL